MVGWDKTPLVLLDRATSPGVPNSLWLDGIWGFFWGTEGMYLHSICGTCFSCRGGPHLSPTPLQMAESNKPSLFWLSWVIWGN